MTRKWTGQRPTSGEIISEQTQEGKEENITKALLGEEKTGQLERWMQSVRQMDAPETFVTSWTARH